MIAALKGLLINLTKAGAYLINLLAVAGVWLAKRIVYIIIAFVSLIVGFFIIKKGND